MDVLKGKKILLVANFTSNIWWFRRRLIMELSRAGADVYMAACLDGNAARVRELPAKLIPIKSNLNSFNPLRELLTIFYLIRIYRGVRPDLVHQYNIKPNLYGPMIARLTGVKAIICMITGLGGVYAGQGLIRRILTSLVNMVYRHSLKKSNIVYFTNKDDSAYFKKRGLVLESRIRYIPGAGVDVGRYRGCLKDEGQEIRNKIGIDADKKVILFVGRLIREKGIYDLCQAFAGIEDDSYRLVIVGPEYAHNANAVKPEEIKRCDSRIIYWGEADDVLPFYAMADVVALPSFREGMSTVLLEAAAAGVPVVATNVPGCREVVDNGVTGLLVPLGDKEELARSIIHLLQDDGLRLRMSMAARNRAMKFDQGRVIKKVMEDYRYVLVR